MTTTIDQTRRHARAMTAMLLDVFDADIVRGGYASPEIPWEIGAQSYMADHGCKTSRTGMLLESEKKAKARAAEKLDQAREALGVKKKRKPKKIKDKIR
jgi:hypothetical protein